MINRVNMQQQTPLYEACKHGNLDVVKFFIKEGANPHLQSFVSKKEKENLLQVAARWNHLQVFDYLIVNIAWSKQEIKSVAAMKGTSKEVRRMVKLYSRLHFGCLFNFCLV